MATEPSSSMMPGTRVSIPSSVSFVVNLISSLTSIIIHSRIGMVVCAGTDLIEILMLFKRSALLQMIFIFLPFVFALGLIYKIIKTILEVLLLEYVD